MKRNTKETGSTQENSIDSIITALEYISAECSHSEAKNVIDATIKLCSFIDDTKIDATPILTQLNQNNNGLSSAVRSLEFLKNETIRCGFEEAGMFLESAFNLCAALYYFQVRGERTVGASQVN